MPFKRNLSLVQQDDPIAFLRFIQIGRRPYDGNPFGEPEANISHKVDVLDYCEAKRNAIGCHASQVTDSQWFLSMPPDVFTAAFGAEWFIRKGQSGPPKLSFLTDELTPS